MRWLWLLPPLVSVAHGKSAKNDTQSSLLWGPYRPNLYFGLRPRIPQSLMTGMMWFGTQDYQSISKTRHACDQADELQSYSWTVYDAEQGGIQVIKDNHNNVKITTAFLKVPGGQHGGSWGVRISGEPIDPTIPSRISMIWYLGNEGIGGIELENDEDENGLEGDVALAGNTIDLDEFKMHIVDGPDNHQVNTGPHAHAYAQRIGKTHYAGFRVAPEHIWQAKEFILQNIIGHAQPIISTYTDPHAGVPDPSWTLSLSDEAYIGSTLHAVQKFFDGPFSFDVYFDSASNKQKLSATTMNEGIAALTQSYDERFQQTFPVPPSYSTPDPKGLQAFSKALTANLLGGVGYFYGNSIIDPDFTYEWDEDDEQLQTSETGFETKGARFTEPTSLFTATPSRSFFPRGFYWDEGFHLIHIGQWENDISLEILKSWIDLIDSDGWVAREQILGDEARSKVPSQFQTQVPSFANPPTLAMAVTAYIARVSNPLITPSDADLGMGFDAQVPLGENLRERVDSPEEALEFLKGIYKPLKRHYDWFRRTQRGQIKQYGRKARSRTEAYRWRGRSDQHVLTSGMDDYPRGPPSTGELHLDLISWMGFFSRTMKEIAAFVGEKDDELTFEEIEQAIINNIDDLHWSEEDQMYCDVGVDNEDDSYHVCHKGYLSLFPFMLGLLPADSPHLGPILELLRDPKELWSPYGIRSLSISHPEFGQGENYWKGPIWLQMNYLVLSSLYKIYGAQPGPLQSRAIEIYDELRRNVVDNAFQEYERTGYVWEQYDSVTGTGQRSHPFTGWSSLITLIISEKY